MLACDFEIVGVANDGYETLDACQRLDPDVIVLDVAMPGLDGFQTARELKRSGSRAAIVFLTMYESEEYVGEGFRAGGRGYVVKTRAYEDLARAIKRVLAGQLVAPSIKSLLTIAGEGGGHAARYFSDVATFVQEMGDCLHLALRRGDAVAVATQSPIRTGLARHLQGLGWNVQESGTHGRYRAIDSFDVLSSILRDGHIDVDRFTEVIEKLDRHRVETAEGPTPRLVIVGELSVPLFLSGNPTAAMEAERVWNQLTRALPFFTVCCYPAAFFDDRSPETFSAVCAEHWAIA